MVGALGIVALEHRLADYLLGRPGVEKVTHFVQEYGIDSDFFLGLANVFIIAACTYLSQALVDSILTNSSLVRTLILKGHNIEGKYINWMEDAQGWTATCTTFSHDGRNYREHGRVYREDGTRHATYDLRMTLFRAEEGILEFTYNEQRDQSGDKTTGHGEYTFHLQPIVLWGSRLPLLERYSEYDAWYTDDRAATVLHTSKGSRLSWLCTQEHFRELPVQLFGSLNEGTLARIFLVQLAKENRAQEQLGKKQERARLAEERRTKRSKRRH